MKLLKIPFLSLLVCFSAGGYAMEEYGTYLCGHKYNKEKKHYYCSYKIRKVIFDANFDKFYYKEGFKYTDQVKDFMNKNLVKINNSVDSFDFEIEDQILGIKRMPKKHEAYYYINFSQPDYVDKKLRINYLVSINGKNESRNIAYDISSENSFESEFKKCLEDIGKGVFRDLYTD